MAEILAEKSAKSLRINQYTLLHNLQVKPLMTRVSLLSLVFNYL